MNRTYLPTSSADQWAALLADPVKHWRTGYSARTLAHCWNDADGFPAELKAAFRENKSFADIEMLLAVPEHQVPLPGGSRPSQNDLWVLARANGQLVSIAVEGKVAEPFGPTVGEWLTDKTPDTTGVSAGKTERLEYLRQLLGLPSVPRDVRYQLLHRTASALIEAKRFTASRAVMVVHSFSKSRQWFEDYVAFAALFGCSAEVNRICLADTLDGIELHLGWVCGDEHFLTR